MAVIMTKQGNLDNVVTYEHICDTAADMQTIDPHYVTLGSVCIVVNGESGGLEAYIANSNKEWENIIVAGGSEGAPTLPIEILSSADYDSETGFPLLADPVENVIYLVPFESETDNVYREWIYINDTWEKFGPGIVATPDWSVTGIYSAGYIANKPAIFPGTGMDSIVEGVPLASTIQFPDPDNTSMSRTGAQGVASHVEGINNYANGVASHAEGGFTQAYDNFSHAEGKSTEAKGLAAHAEGKLTTALNEAAHAEGKETMAFGKQSHAEGLHTIAKANNQHVFGKYNTEDIVDSNKEGTYVEIVGNGESSATSNARTLDWNGNEWLAGNLTLNQTTLTESKLQYLNSINVENAVNAITPKTITLSGTDLIVNAEANTRYICGELSTLSFTPVVSGICDILFTSGSSKTILTLPNTVKMPDWFEVEANMTYEINIMDGIYGVVTSWTV